MSTALALMYHRIGEGSRYTVSFDDLVWQIAALKKRGFTFVFADDLSTWKPSDGKVCALTFDDGTIDNLVLKELDVPLTIFLCTQPDAQEIGCNPSDLDPKQLVQEMVLCPHVRFGSHGISHKKWTQLSLLDLQQELRESKAQIEEWWGQPVQCCAYPKGSTNPEIIDAVAQVYASAFLADGGALRSSPDSAYQLPRVGIFGCTSRLMFRLRTSAYFNLLISLWKRFK